MTVKSVFPYWCDFCLDTTHWEDKDESAAQCLACLSICSNDQVNCQTCSEKRYLFLNKGEQCIECVRKEKGGVEKKTISEKCETFCSGQESDWTLLKEGVKQCGECNVFKAEKQGKCLMCKCP